ncbi:hypothetical protein K502DRAFT_366858, partial [Neoconidiobolus thromboides FSU 785]
MSIEIYWENLNSEIEDKVKQELNDALSKLKDKPNFIGDINVTQFQFGKLAPKVEIIDIMDVDPNFYNDNTQTYDSNNVVDYNELLEDGKSITEFNYGIDAKNLYTTLTKIKDENKILLEDDVDSDLEEYQQPEIQFDRNHNFGHHYFHQPVLNQYNQGSNLNNGKNDINEIQFKIKLNYDGDMQCSIQTSLLINFPMSEFAQLPVNVTITGFKLNAIFLIAYLQSQIKISLIAESDEEEIFKELRINSELGEKKKHCLKNVDQVENFLLISIRKILLKKFLFPNFFIHTLKS